MYTKILLPTTLRQYIKYPLDFFSNLSPFPPSFFSFSLPSCPFRPLHYYPLFCLYFSYGNIKIILFDNRHTPTHSYFLSFSSLFPLLLLLIHLPLIHLPLPSYPNNNIIIMRSTTHSDQYFHAHFFRKKNYFSKNSKNFLIF